ncbi:MAG: hypothetical protein GF320_03730 [Armatimonadia bacterium]|nr:hypothetical protein [Armatimonadia bacterium]
MRLTAAVTGIVLAGAFGFLASGCGEDVHQPAYAAFRYVTEDGIALNVGSPPPPEMVSRGIMIRRDRTTLPDGRRVVQQIWVVDPLEAPPPEYDVHMTDEGLVAISGGSFDEFVLTPPEF